jgi:integrin beta 8
MFDPLPFLSCTREICDSDDRTGYSYWLGSQSAPKSSDPKQLVSRCTVCRGRASLLTMHSQTTSIPDCPNTYVSLWEGYSYVMVRKPQSSYCLLYCLLINLHALIQNRGKDLGGTFQDLSSSGSCLERYKGLPFIECNQHGKCARYGTASRGYWLAALDHPERPRTMSTSSARGEDRVSRCRVCATFL